MCIITVKIHYVPWTIYQKSSIEAILRAVQYPTFCTYWRNLLPNIIISKPCTDLCWTCQQNNAAIMRAINRTADEKSQAQMCYVCYVYLCAHVCVHVCCVRCVPLSVFCVLCVCVCVCVLCVCVCVLC